MSPLPYNHVDPPETRKPLPLQLLDRHEMPPLKLNLPYTTQAIVNSSSKKSIRLELKTDSEHLNEFFRRNWKVADGFDEPDGRIAALKELPAAYGLPPVFAQKRWYCPPEKTVLICGTQYYGNIKITVRGLCSEFAAADEMFVHGCSLDIEGNGLLLAGMSGAGKTTLTAALRDLLKHRIRVVNDDWGLVFAVIRLTKFDM